MWVTEQGRAKACRRLWRPMFASSQQRLTTPGATARPSPQLPDMPSGGNARAYECVSNFGCGVNAVAGPGRRRRIVAGLRPRAARTEFARDGIVLVRQDSRQQQICASGLSLSHRPLVPDLTPASGRSSASCSWRKLLRLVMAGQPLKAAICRK